MSLELKKAIDQISKDKGLDRAIASQSRILEMEVLLWGIQHEIGKTEQLLQLLLRSVIGDVLSAEEIDQVGIGR